jgi:hypothetical protein
VATLPAEMLRGIFVLSESRETFHAARILNFEFLMLNERQSRPLAARSSNEFAVAAALFGDHNSKFKIKN